MNKVTVGHLTYDIVEVDKATADGGNYWGCTFHNHQKIHIEKGLSEERRQEVMLHEILHAIYHAYSLDGEDGEERTVTTLAKALMAVNKNNKKFKELFIEA